VDLQADSNRPYILQLQRRLLSDEFPFVPGYMPRRGVNVLVRDWGSHSVNDEPSLNPAANWRSPTLQRRSGRYRTVTPKRGNRHSEAVVRVAPTILLLERVIAECPKIADSASSEPVGEMTLSIHSCPSIFLAYSCHHFRPWCVALQSTARRSASAS
jgi:hypothetical protein